MNIALWAVQALLAVAFLGAGTVKVSQPLEKLKTMMKWVSHTTPGVVRLVGSLEILGALGLILPAITGIVPWLTPIAAAGLALTMLVAIIVHIRLHAPGTIAPVILLLLSLVIIIGRLSFAPLA